MNFQDLKNIESHQTYLDIAFSRASQRVREKKFKSKDHLAKAKQKELTRIQVVRDVLADKLKTILVSFPSIDQLDEFYLQLIKYTLDYKSLKKSLGAVNWAMEQAHSLFREYRTKINKAQNIKYIVKERKEFYGRISSVMKQINNNLDYLEESRKTMKAFPSVKTSQYTVCLFGFPNVGKTTLLTELTDADPEINSYPFTTKRLNLGYIKKPGRSVQLIDTPGTLDRVKKNMIELQAYLVLEHLAHLVVFVFDPTMEHAKQQKLYNSVKKSKLVYLSKYDIADKDDIEELKKEYNAFTSKKELKEEIEKRAKEYYSLLSSTPQVVGNL